MDSLTLHPGLPLDFGHTAVMGKSINHMCLLHVVKYRISFYATRNTGCMVPSLYWVYGTVFIQGVWYRPHTGLWYLPYTGCMVPSSYWVYGTFPILGVWYRPHTGYMVPSWYQHFGHYRKTVNPPGQLYIQPKMLAIL